MTMYANIFVGHAPSGRGQRQCREYREPKFVHGLPEIFLTCGPKVPNPARRCDPVQEIYTGVRGFYGFT
jgi:hypothetical protein